MKQKLCETKKLSKDQPFVLLLYIHNKLIVTQWTNIKKNYYASIKTDLNILDLFDI